MVYNSLKIKLSLLIIFRLFEAENLRKYGGVRLSNLYLGMEDSWRWDLLVALAL